MEAEGYGAYLDQVERTSDERRTGRARRRLFWGMQDLIRCISGVISTRVGYGGGDVKNATYRKHGTRAEAIEIIFYSSKLSYRKLLEFFFQIHDPTTKNKRSGPHSWPRLARLCYCVGLSRRSRGFSDAHQSIWNRRSNHG
jgi:hypothetical protein